MADRLAAFGPATISVELHDDHIRVACPACAAKLKAPEAKLGREVGCPKCRHRFTPAATPAAPVPPVTVPPPAYQPPPTWNPYPMPTAVSLPRTSAARVPDANPFDSLDDEDDEPVPRSRKRTKSPRQWRYVVGAVAGVGLLLAIYLVAAPGQRGPGSDERGDLSNLGVTYHTFPMSTSETPTRSKTCSPSYRSRRATARRPSRNG